MPSTRQVNLTQRPLRTAQINVVLKHKKLANFLVRKYPSWGTIRSAQDNEERLQAALLGLCLAMPRFKKEKGSFASYAQHWVRHALQRYLTSDHPVYIPAHSRYKMLSVMAIYRRISTRKGEEKALRFLHWVIERYRLHDLWTVVSHGKIEEEVADYRKERSISADEIERIHLLSDREQLVIRFRYGINTQERTLEYIAENLLDGISRERVRQIEANAIRKLRGQ